LAVFVLQIMVKMSKTNLIIQEYIIQEEIIMKKEKEPFHSYLQIMEIYQDQLEQYHELNLKVLIIMKRIKEMRLAKHFK
jgi:hypothetical protein